MGEQFIKIIIDSAMSANVCYTKAIKMTYNFAFKKRIVRHDLIESIGLERNQYWGFLKLSDEQFYKIAQRGGADKILINRN